jgi:hypothetical protein
MKKLFDLLIPHPLFAGCISYVNHKPQDYNLEFAHNINIDLSDIYLHLFQYQTMNMPIIKSESSKPLSSDPLVVWLIKNIIATIAMMTRNAPSPTIQLQKDASFAEAVSLCIDQI